MQKTERRIISIALMLLGYVLFFQLSCKKKENGEVPSISSLTPSYSSCTVKSFTYWHGTARRFYFNSANKLSSFVIADSASMFYDSFTLAYDKNNKPVRIADEFNVGTSYVITYTKDSLADTIKVIDGGGRWIFFFKNNYAAGKMPYSQKYYFRDISNGGRVSLYYNIGLLYDKKGNMYSYDVEDSTNTIMQYKAAYSFDSFTNFEAGVPDVFKLVLDYEGYIMQIGPNNIVTSDQHFLSGSPKSAFYYVTKFNSLKMPEAGYSISGPSVDSFSILYNCR